jgi:hypothetical protein
MVVVVAWNSVICYDIRLRCDSMGFLFDFEWLLCRLDTLLYKSVRWTSQVHLYGCGGRSIEGVGDVLVWSQSPDFVYKSWMNRSSIWFPVFVLQASYFPSLVIVTFLYIHAAWTNRVHVCDWPYTGGTWSNVPSLLVVTFLCMYMERDRFVGSLTKIYMYVFLKHITHEYLSKSST